MTGPTGGDKIKHKASPAHCLSVREGKAQDGTDIILWPCSDTPEFGWLVSDEYIRLKSNPDYCMTVREGRAGDGSDIILWTCEAPEPLGVDMKTTNKRWTPPANEFQWVFDG